MRLDKEIQEFTQAVGAIAPQPGNEYYSKFKSIFKRSNYFLLGNKFLVVKISRIEKPFWALEKTTLIF